MQIHKNARLTPVLREEVAHRVLVDLVPVCKVAGEYKVSSKTVAKWAKRLRQEGSLGAVDRSCRPHRSPRQKSPDRSDDECRSLLISMIHRPPSDFAINRTSWRLVDLHRIIGEQGTPISRSRMRRVMKSTGFKWRKAKIVLTSADPEYTEKVAKIKEILFRLEEDEAFFSIDEFGPFSIKRKGGRKIVCPEEFYSVPQQQKSKGWLILTAALELSGNQVSRFYSTKKNTDEMIRMAEKLREEYADRNRIYLSWDAAAWHMSKKLKAHIEQLNRHSANKFPVIELAPLPAGSQFLNVIESVFSGMARAIIHNSDYPSPELAKAAIDKYLSDRNVHFKQNPRRAGKTIWGMERAPSQFSEANNCKDPAYSNPGASQRARRSRT